jgi:hypothetical protein
LEIWGVGVDGAFAMVAFPPFPPVNDNGPLPPQKAGRMFRDWINTKKCQPVCGLLAFRNAIVRRFLFLVYRRPRNKVWMQD